MKKTKNSIVTDLVNKGFTYEKAGYIFGLTRQRVYAINKKHNNKNIHIRCVNCGLECGGKIKSGVFIFKNDPINLCFNCSEILRNC